MELAIKIVLILHFVGLSLLLGGALYQVWEKAKNIVRPMLDGAYTQLLTGIILLGLLHASHKATDPAINDAWFGVKLLIALVITVLCFMNRKKRTNKSRCGAASWASRSSTSPSPSSSRPSRLGAAPPGGEADPGRPGRRLG